VGTSPGDALGFGSTVSALIDGNYVVGSRFWDNGIVVDAGAATWGNGVTGTAGTVSALNSFVGSTANDRVGGLIVALPAGRYSVLSSDWDFGAIVNASAATLGVANGTTAGPLSLANSVPGWVSSATDRVSGTAWDPARERLAVGRGTAVSFISYETISFDGFE